MLARPRKVLTAPVFALWSRAATLRTRLRSHVGPGCSHIHPGCSDMHSGCKLMHPGCSRTHQGSSLVLNVNPCFQITKMRLGSVQVAGVPAWQHCRPSSRSSFPWIPGASSLGPWLRYEPGPRSRTRAHRDAAVRPRPPVKVADRAALTSQTSAPLSAKPALQQRRGGANLPPGRRIRCAPPP